MVEVKHLSGGIDKHSAIRDVSFKLPNGAIYGIYDASSEYASSLLALMSGACIPHDGKVLINGFDMQKETQKAKKCTGYLPCNLLPDSELTVSEYLMFIADAKNLSYERTVRYVQELLDLTDLSAHKDRLISSLSFGERRIVGILQALIGNPEILLLDSPSVGTTPRDAQRIRALISHVAQNKTVFLCERSLSDLGEICSEIIILSNGVLQAVAPSAEAAAIASRSATNEPSPGKEVGSVRWKLLTQSNDEYELIDSDKEEK